MGSRVVYGTVAVASVFGTILGFACTEYSAEPTIEPPARDSGSLEDDADAGVVSTADAADDGAAAATCAAACSGANRGCDGGTCVVSCSYPNARCEGGATTCPAGIPCAIECTNNLACQDVSCGDASECVQRCHAKDACRQPTCGNAAKCTFECQAENSCRTPSCGNAKDCTVNCLGDKESCRDPIDCPTRADSTCTVNCADNCYNVSVRCCIGAMCTITGTGATKSDVTCP